MRIVATDLTKRYGTGENQVIALHKANLEIQARDFISIVGPSGSGKSTLLHLISGLDYPTEGVVEYDGQNIHQGKDAVLSAFRRRRIGFIFQKFHLILWVSFQFSDVILFQELYYHFSIHFVILIV